MSAEALEQSAKEMNISLKVEKWEAMGVEGGITEEEIEAAHAIIIAADTDVQEARFEGKPIVKISCGGGHSESKGIAGGSIGEGSGTKQIGDKTRDTNKKAAA
ncbi:MULTISPECIES: PTS sugar transporter subunit IIB [Paenibacillus]|uniref:hypothetical protein n=1 Tax=Paenibacillus TaxID=44249 RepID=UPI0001AFD9E7|nr:MULTISPECIES: hypothetical protein [unclassified Paenibacillus]EES72601.1 fructose-like phosphotransferase enzyme IIB component 2 family protein [Paenibacillus sp. oral taxon 786 str. D14]OXL87497.1 hypothetical protein BCV73_33905 [Paenibacillus sp. SSG-1]